MPQVFKSSSSSIETVEKQLGRQSEEIQAKITKKWGKNSEAKRGVVEKTQNQNGVTFLSDLKMQGKSLLCSWTSTISVFYYTCRYSLIILSMFWLSNVYLSFLTKIWSAYLVKISLIKFCKIK